MSGPDDPFSFDAEFGDPDYVKSARDPNLPPQTGKEWVDCRASDIPVTPGGEPSPFEIDDEFGTSGEPASPASQERTRERAGTDDQNPADDFSNEFETAAPPADDLPPPPGAPMVEHALYYARRGWPVFPCKPTNKAPFFEGGFHVATTDEKTIRGWWGYWPKAMIGVPMGSRSGVWAIDPDPPKKPEEPDGRVVLAKLVAENGDLPATHTEVTPRGGQHIFFKWDPGRPMTNSPGALAKTNIDIRGEGGYVIVAPSACLGDGSAKNVAGQYCVAEPLDFFHFATAPVWLYDLILQKPEPQPVPKPEQTATVAPQSSREPNDGNQFWRKINQFAFQNLAAWVPDIFGSAAVYKPNTGAYRITSEVLGRDLEEDLSISPLGAKDWGVWDIGDAKLGKRSAIDIVIEYGGKRVATEAALWLCKRCGVDPTTLGWNSAGRSADDGEGAGPKAERDPRSKPADQDQADLGPQGKYQEAHGNRQDAPPRADEGKNKNGSISGSSGGSGSRGVAIDDFYAYMPDHSYIFVPTREMWRASSVNSRLPAVAVLKEGGTAVVDAKGKPKLVRPSVWLDTNRPVEQMTWVPGEPLTIGDKLIAEGGWVERSGVTTFNLYRPPVVRQGNSANADRWVELVQRLYPDDAEHIIAFCAHRIQYPAVKINHGLILGGAPGIGKDTILEPLKLGVGPWNFKEVSPQDIMSNYNDYLQCVVLRISEARDLGEVNRYAFFEHMKTILATPPDVIRVNAKYMPQHYVVNVAGVIYTTNHRFDGVFLPADDRRTYVAWSEVTSGEFVGDFWKSFWGWYGAGGLEDVVAYLSEHDLSKFDPKAPPKKTEAFWQIVGVGAAPEEAELKDILDKLGAEEKALDADGKPCGPVVTTLAVVVGKAEGDLFEWLKDRKNRRVIPHRFERCGYVPVRNENAEDRLWVIKGKRQVVYGRLDVPLSERIDAARRLA